MINYIYNHNRERGGEMYNFVSEAEENTTVKLHSLIEYIVEMENAGDLSPEDTDECIALLRRVSEISRVDLDLDDYNDLLE